MDDNTLKYYYTQFTSAWKLFRTFKDAKTDEDRARLVTAATGIYNKYHTDFMREIIWVVFNELERRAKNEQQTKKENQKASANGTDLR